MMAIISLLGRNQSVTVGDKEESRLLEDLKVSLDIYILLIPYITFVPYEIILLRLLRKNNTEDLTPKQKKLSKFAKWTAIVLMTILSMLCIYALLAIAESVS